MRVVPKWSGVTILFVKTVTGRINSDNYIKLMKITAIPLMSEILPDGFVLQQDNCSTHVSKKILAIFEETGIELLPWPSRSPDLDIKENVWSMLSSRVYDGPQPKNKQELEERNFEAVDHKNSHLSENLKTLFSSLHSHFLSCLRRNGNKFLIDYF